MPSYGLVDWWQFRGARRYWPRSERVVSDTEANASNFLFLVEFEHVDSVRPVYPLLLPGEATPLFELHVDDTRQAAAAELSNPHDRILPERRRKEPGAGNSAPLFPIQDVTLVRGGVIVGISGFIDVHDL